MVLTFYLLRIWWQAIDKYFDTVYPYLSCKFIFKQFFLTVKLVEININIKSKKTSYTTPFAIVYENNNGKTI